MIHFKKVRWRNFLSTGNAFTEIQLDVRPTTLIVGENGSGKSTLLDAICFALFSKPYRNINKPQLVNTINGKNCVVEIEFFIGSKNYKIIRGIKPAIFEIWVDNVLLNQDAASRDYQKYLEENILKLNYKSFTQIVILGSASFTPFMQLPAAARREVIEDILDIKIFTSMNLVLKDKMSELKTKMTEVENKIALAKNKAEIQQDYIKTLEEDRDARIADIENKIQEATHEIHHKRDLLSHLDDRRTSHFTSIGDASSVNEAVSEILRQVREFTERFIQRLELEKADVSQKVGNIEVEKAKLKDLAKDTLGVVKERSELNELGDYYDIAGILLKDSGIKTKIIRQYLPAINKLVNKFLTSMDFFVQFTLDEKFDEVIKSRYRDDFSYESFSEGEKQRIDLALLFTWRTIAKLKNSASTNLLILDEVFDSSLDNSATDYVMTLLNTLGDGTNVWVISHKGDQLFDKFAHVVKFTKRQNFSVIV